MNVRTSFRATEVADVLCASLGLHSDRLGTTTRLASNAGVPAGAAGAAATFSVLIAAEESGGTAVLHEAPLLPLQGRACNEWDRIPLCRSVSLRIMLVLDTHA